MTDGVRIVNDIHELTADVSGSRFWNPDISPVTSAARRWRTWDIAALWASMAICIPTYTLGATLITRGLDWRQGLIAVLLGNLIVLVPMIMNAHAGTKYGIPFPVLCRSSFGLLGANVAALLRAIVACGWFGIQTWIGGWAIYKLLTLYFPAWNDLPASVFGINLAQFACFMVFWAANIWVVWRGMESIRFVEDYAAPLLLVLGCGLLMWAWLRAGGFGPMLSQPSYFAMKGVKAGSFWKTFVPILTANVSFWATLSLNIADFTRYAKSQRDQVIGQTIGLPGTMVLYSFIGLAVTSATIVIFGYPVWDPVELVSRFRNLGIMTISLGALFLATLTTNLAANVVSPANDFSNLWPKRISFRMGGVITGIIGILMMPWKLYNDPGGYILVWLVGYSALLGPIGGIMIADYFVLRRTRLNLVDLYREDGEYRYTGGVHLKAIAALLLGVAPSVPGFLAQINIIRLPSGSFFDILYPFAWFTGFVVSSVSYLILAALDRRGKQK